MLLQDQHHRNIMELLVYEEIAQQMTDLPQNLQREINVIQVAAYALNRLPPLYATSREGFYEQHKTSRETMMPQLHRLITEAFEMVSVNPHFKHNCAFDALGHWSPSNASHLAIA